MLDKRLESRCFFADYLKKTPVFRSNPFFNKIQPALYAAVYLLHASVFSIASAGQVINHVADIFKFGTLGKKRPVIR